MSRAGSPPLLVALALVLIYGLIGPVATFKESDALPADRSHSLHIADPATPEHSVQDHQAELNKFGSEADSDQNASKPSEEVEHDGGNSESIDANFTNIGVLVESLEPESTNSSELNQSLVPKEANIVKPVEVATLMPELMDSILPTGECIDKCSQNTCNGHGVCQLPSCDCNCTTGYTGQYCQERVAVIYNFKLRPPPKPCPDNCSGQGACNHNGTCDCEKGWAGLNCSIECVGGAANPCSGHGMCNKTDGKCICAEGYEGKFCNRRTLPQNVEEYRKTLLGQTEKEEPKAEAATEQAASSGEKQPAEPDATKNASEATANVTAASDQTEAKNGTEGSKIQWVRGHEIDYSRLASFGVNHASFDLGAKALGSNKEAKGEGALLKNDRDKYWISPCKVEKGKYVVIELNELVYVHTIVIGSFEYYSSTVNAFQVLGSLSYPTETWNLLGHFQASSSRKLQEFKLGTKKLAKYVKLRLLSHHANEFYCTLSSVRVYGTTQWEEMSRMLDENEDIVEAAKRRLDGVEEQKKEEEAAAPAAAHKNESAPPREEAALPAGGTARDEAAGGALGANKTKGGDEAAPGAAKTGGKNETKGGGAGAGGEEGRAAAAVGVTGEGGKAANETAAGGEGGNATAEGEGEEAAEGEGESAREGKQSEQQHGGEVEGGGEGGGGEAGRGAEGEAMAAGEVCRQGVCRAEAKAEGKEGGEGKSGGAEKSGRGGKAEAEGAADAVGGTGAEAGAAEGSQGEEEGLGTVVNALWQGLTAGEGKKAGAVAEGEGGALKEGGGEEGGGKEAERPAAEGSAQGGEGRGGEGGEGTPRKEEGGEGASGEGGEGGVEKGAGGCDGEGCDKPREEGQEGGGVEGGGGEGSGVVEGAQAEGGERTGEGEEAGGAEGGGGESGRGETDGGEGAEGGGEGEEEGQAGAGAEEEEAQKTEAAAEERRREEEEEEKRREEEERQRKAEELRKLVSTPKGETSFFQKVPAKIKDIEITQSLLQSYVQEIKKQYDESFEELQNEMGAMKGTLEVGAKEARADAAESAQQLRLVAERAAALQELVSRQQAQLRADAERLAALELSTSWLRWSLHAETLVLILLLFLARQMGRASPLDPLLAATARVYTALGLHRLLPSRFRGLLDAALPPTARRKFHPNLHPDPHPPHHRRRNSEGELLLPDSRHSSSSKHLLRAQSSAASLRAPAPRPRDLPTACAPSAFERTCSSPQSPSKADMLQGKGFSSSMSDLHSRRAAARPGATTNGVRKPRKKPSSPDAEGGGRDWDVRRDHAPSAEGAVDAARKALAASAGPELVRPRTGLALAMPDIEESPDLRFLKSPPTLDANAQPAGHAHGGHFALTPPASNGSSVSRAVASMELAGSQGPAPVAGGEASAAELLTDGAAPKKSPWQKRSCSMDSVPSFAARQAQAHGKLSVVAPQSNPLPGRNLGKGGQLKNVNQFEALTSPAKGE